MLIKIEAVETKLRVTGKHDQEKILLNGLTTPADFVTNNNVSHLRSSTTFESVCSTISM